MLSFREEGCAGEREGEGREGILAILNRRGLQIRRHKS